MEMNESSGGGGGPPKDEDPTFFLVGVVSVEFKTDHDLILDNRRTFQKAGGRYPKPEWTYDKAEDRVPVSHSKLKKVQIDTEFIAKCDSTKSGTVTGEIPSGLTLKSNGTTSFKNGEKVKVAFESAAPLPDTISMSRFSIPWTIEVSGESTRNLSSGQHVLFITWSDPIDNGEPEDGVTFRRMYIAVSWVGEAWENGTRDPVEIVDHLFGKFPRYTLGFKYLSKADKKWLIKNPDVVKAMVQAGFADYRKTAAGGAWPLAHFLYFGGECQAIVRLIRGIIHQIGMPGKVEVKYVNADAGAPYTAVIKDHGTRCTGPRSDRAYALVDSRVVAGRRYPNDGKIGWNNYEAYLKYTHGKEYWYGGGIGRLDEGYDPLMVFYGLAEFELVYDSSLKQHVRSVTQVWKY